MPSCLPHSTTLCLQSIFFGCLLMIMCHSQGDYHQTVSKNVSNWNDDTNGVRVVQLIYTHPPWIDSRQVSVVNQFEIVPNDTNRYFAFKVAADKNSWSFHPTIPSFLQLTMYGTSTINSDNEAGLLLMFNDELTNGATTTYFSSLIQVDGSPVYNNKITPRCDTSATPTATFLHGDGVSFVLDSDSTEVRRNSAGFTDNYLNSTYDWQPPQSGSSVYWPIKFVIANYPNVNETHVTFITPNYTQQCKFGESFPTERDLAFWFTADKAAQEIWFDRFDLEFWYNLTAAPTESSSSPTGVPSLSPSSSASSQPSVSPTSYPSVSPSSGPSLSPSSSPSSQPSASPTGSTSAPSFDDNVEEEGKATGVKVLMVSTIATCIIYLLL